MGLFSRTLLNPAGGLRYHLRAYRNSDELWAPFRAGVGEWLEKTWAPRRDTLVIFGPSGGYCMNWHWLKRFQRIVAVDPDPLARWIFNRRMRRSGVYAQLKWVPENLFANGPGGFRKLLEAEPGAAILFSNLIGQLPLVLSDGDLASFRAELGILLRDRSWASFHDRLSGTLEPRIQDGSVFPARPSESELIERFFRASVRGGEAPSALELLDHGTEQFFPAEMERRYFSWEIDPGQFHLIEGVCAR